MNAWQTVATCAVAYLLGSVSFAWLFAKVLKGVDLRTVGSGNLGATNASRLLGFRIGAVIYLLDFAKGFVPVIVLRRFAGDPLAFGTVPVSLLAGLAAFVGHCFPAWHGLRGGKGVATASGVILGLTPLAALCVLAVFGITVAASRRISAGSVLAAIVLPLAQLVFHEGPSAGAARATLVLYVAIAVIVIVRHRQNVVRLLAGREPRIGERSP